uniref:Reverse transcriptase RNase H-like domain-containing protein n=1 Tax=Amphimedon queenslandica TaxID=400682 RepID=A0A1X7U785_AMPQE
KPYRVPYSKREVLQEKIQKMLDHGVIRPDNVKWTESCEKAIQDLQNSLSKEPILLTGDDQMEHPVAFASRRLLLLETRYFTVEKECLAIVWALNYFKIYLLGQQFVIETDHKPLSWLHRMKNNNARLMRGSLNANADGLSQAGKNERMMSDSAVPDPPPSS